MEMNEHSHIQHKGGGRWRDLMAEFCGHFEQSYLT